MEKKMYVVPATKYLQMATEGMIAESLQLHDNVVNEVQSKEEMFGEESGLPKAKSVWDE